MITTLIMAVVIGQAPKPAPVTVAANTNTITTPVKQWYGVSNQPGWEGYGYVNQAGWLEVDKFRRIGTTQEVPPAQPPSGALPATTTMPVTTVSMPATTTAPTAADVAVQGMVVSGDPYGFTAWLNSTRAAYGLAPVGYDPNLSSWAAMNNGQQAARGIGHYVFGPARRQNAAMGSFPGIEQMWMASRGHRAALLDPTIRWIGIAALGSWWTFNAN